MQAAVVTGCTGAVGLGLIDALMKNNVKVIAVVRKDSKRSYRIKESHSLKKVECDLSELDNCHSLCRRQELNRMCSITLGGMEHLVTAAMICIYRI